MKRILALRKIADDRVGSNTDILGSMIGLKFTAGKLTRRLGITYFVREKIPKLDLSPRQRIPAKLRIDDSQITTDVVLWPFMEEQILPNGTILFDGQLQGTLTCFGASPLGTFGISCVHCLTGIDGNPATPTKVSAYAGIPGQFPYVGQSIYLAYTPGMGILDNFGYLDCGLFDLRDEVLSQRAKSSQSIDVINDIHSLIGQKLFGISALFAPDSTSSMRKAIVIGVEATALGERCDLVLNVLPPGTFRGDSGMLWLTETGKAAAIHARGEIMAGLQGSLITTAMSAKRAAQALGVQLRID